MHDDLVDQVRRRARNRFEIIHTENHLERAFKRLTRIIWICSDERPVVSVDYNAMCRGEKPIWGDDRSPTDMPRSLCLGIYIAERSNGRPMRQRSSLSGNDWRRNVRRLQGQCYPVLSTISHHSQADL